MSTTKNRTEKQAWSEQERSDLEAALKEHATKQAAFAAHAAKHKRSKESVQGFYYQTMRQHTPRRAASRPQTTTLSITNENAAPDSRYDYKMEVTFRGMRLGELISAQQVLTRELAKRAETMNTMFG